jgi:hypothetical protein
MQSPSSHLKGRVRHNVGPGLLVCSLVYHKTVLGVSVAKRRPATSHSLPQVTSRALSCSWPRLTHNKRSLDKAFTLFEIAQRHSVNEQEIQASRLSQRTLFDFESQWNLETSHGVPIANNKLGSCGQNR